MELKLGKKDMREELISVIVPAFNAENYIERCLQSIQRQTYRHLEIIVVNDGSIDKTDDLVEEMQNKDSRIILINKKMKESLVLEMMELKLPVANTYFL